VIAAATNRPSEDEEDWHINSNKSDSDYADEFKSMVRFERTGKVGDPLILIISVECGHSPTVRVYSQYWILDKTGTSNAATMLHSARLRGPC
jgi:hypothetical protein